MLQRGVRVLGLVGVGMVVAVVRLLVELVELVVQAVAELVQIMV